MTDPIKGWKCFDIDLKCRGFQFEVGKTYEHTGDIVMCKSGFHFHHNGSDLFKYYSSCLRQTRVCEIVAHGAISDTDKSVCSKIEIVRELSLFEIGSVVGSGYGDGDGSGSGDGYGYGSGYGSGYGDGYGYGSGDGYGYGYGSGSGDGYGYGSGYGYGYGEKIPFIIGFFEGKAA